MSKNLILKNPQSRVALEQFTAKTALGHKTRKLPKEFKDELPSPDQIAILLEHIN